LSRFESWSASSVGLRHGGISAKRAVIDETSPTLSARPAAIILAAGKGTRMKGDLPKVVHHVGGRPMVRAVVDACREAQCGRIVVVVGYKQELVREALSGEANIEYAVQDQQLGTGHAVLCAEPAFMGTGWAQDVFVLCGDGPLIRASTLRELLTRHRGTGAAATLATSIIDDPQGYGRIVRDEQGKFVAIVEQKNTTEAQRAIREVNPSYYCFRQQELFESLKKVERNPLTGEYYLTDTLSLLLGEGQRVEVVPSVPPEDVLSINTPDDLAVVDRIYRARTAAALDAATLPGTSPKPEGRAGTGMDVGGGGGMGGGSQAGVGGGAKP
jgi:bifunctional UDP-N-acetylglucosamine pyrophosphorylase / glucosamine-1-phosphate N-acetyltransferase